MSKPETTIAEIEAQEPEETAPLAEDIDLSIQSFASRAGLSSSNGNAIGISPEQGLAMLRPAIRMKVTNDPEEALKMLAIIHLETKALIEKHSDTDPLTLVE